LYLRVDILENIPLYYAGSFQELRNT